MHALCRSCEVQQETSELAQHGRAHGDMADLPLHPSVAQPLSPPAGDEDLNVAVGYRIGVVQSWEQAQAWARQWGGEWGAGISHVCLHPSECPGRTFPERSWRALQFPIPCWEGALSEACVWKDNHPLPLPFAYFFPLMKKKGGNRSLRKQRKRLSPGPGLSHQSSVGGEEVRPGVRMGAARSQAACWNAEKFPCLFKYY